MNRRGLAAAVLVLPWLLTGCGDDSDDDSAKDDGNGATEGPAPEEAAVEDALVASLLDPDCGLVTDDYLLATALFSETVEEACEERVNGWIEPQYDADDVVVSDIVIAGDVATALVGSEYTNITTTYELMLVDGDWLVSCDEYNCDHLDEPSAEVS